jgi:multiple sugar transport system substrate-binding protein
MKRLLLIVLTVMMISVGLFANGGSEKTDSDSPVTITYWHLWGGSRTELIDQLISRYTELHPNVIIEPTFTPPNELQKKVVQAAGTGTLPDVVQIHTGWYSSLMPETTLTNLDEYLKGDNIVIEDILVAAEAERCYFNGSVYSLPNVNAGAQGLFFYNKDLMLKAGLDPVADAPSDWESFMEVSRTLVEKLNDDELNVIAWDPYQMAGQPATIIFSYGAGFPTVSDDGKTSRFNDPGILATAKAFEEYVDTVYGRFGGYKALLEWNSRVAGADTGAAQVQAFINEGQAFYVSGSWTIGQVKSGNSDMDFGIIPVPGFNGPHGGTAKNGWSYAISNNSEQKQAAYDFLKFITIDPAGNGAFCIAQGRPCPISSVNNDPAYSAMGDMWTNLVASMNTDIVPTAPDINQDALKPWLRDVPNRRIAGESIEDIYASIHAQYQDYLDDLYN